MEVHAHTHTAPASGGTGRKKWTHYFWEFLMLFLAVFCGFLAEYQLEHKIEKDREKQFINSLAADLKDDIAKSEAYSEREQGNIRLLDTLCVYLDNPALARERTDIIYYAARVGPRTSPFVSNSRTFDQLRNSGAFRLIRNITTSNRIMEHYSRIPHIRLLENNFYREFDYYKDAAAVVIDPGIYRRQEDANGTIKRSNDNPLLLSYDKALLKKMEFHAIQMNGSRRSIIVLLRSFKRSAEDLLQYLRDYYHLK